MQGEECLGGTAQEPRGALIFAGLIRFYDINDSVDRSRDNEPKATVQRYYRQSRAYISDNVHFAGTSLPNRRIVVLRF